MKERSKSNLAPRLFFLAFVLILVVSVLYSRAVRRFALGDEFQYIPRESVLVAATGEIESIWRGLDAHLGTALRGETEGDSPLAQVRKWIQEEEIQIPGLDDLSRWGLDIHRGILLSSYRVTQSEDQFLLVIPVTDGRLFFKFLNAELDLKPRKKFSWKDREGSTYTVHEFDDFFAAVPQPGIFVASDSIDLLRRSLLLRRDNLAHATANDVLYKAIKRRLRGPLATGPNVFVYWQSRTAPFSERTGVLRLESDTLRIESDIELAGAPVRVFDALRHHNASPFDWPQRLPPETLAVLMVEDRHLDLYRNFLAEQILQQPLEIPDVTRMLFAVTDFEDGLPDVLVGLWGNPDELERVAASTQRRLRQSRDLILLNGALEEYRKNGGSSPSLTELQRLELLQPERDSLFHRYPFLPEGIGDPELGRKDFSTKTYERTMNGHKIFFLAPPVTENDLRYRPELIGAEPEDLRSDRYRMACLFLEDSLWIATDVRDLERLTVAAPEARPGLESNAAFQAASAEWRSGAKMQAFVALDRIISLGLLNPGSDLDTLVRDGLIDLEGYSILELEAAPSADQQRLVIKASLRRGTPR